MNFMLTEPSSPPFNQLRIPPRAVTCFVSVCLVVSIGSCDLQGQGPGHRDQALAISPSEELEVGRAAAEEVMRKARVEASGRGADVVTRAGRRISALTQNDALMREINLHVSGRSFDWQYHVIAEDQVNAFCLPGGEIFVFTGLLHVVQSEDELAAVMSHEVAHTLAHHVSERIARERTIGSGILALSYNREQESEADHIGLFLMAFAGYDPEAAVTFWQDMGQRRAKYLALPEILSDHPSDAHRLQQLQDWVPQAQAAKRAWDEGRVVPAAR
jgi:predicted Zn-dependent protease